MDRILDAAAAEVQQDGLLFIYYAGHGIVGSDRRLYLSLPDTEPDAPHASAVPYDWVRMRIDANRAERRVVMLDCCYAGRAGMGAFDPHELANRVAVDRTCLLLAAADDEEAMAPTDARYTAFSGELIDLLTDGIDRGPELLDVQTIWEHLVLRLKAKRSPVPQLRSGNAGENLPLVRNPAPRSQDRRGQVLYASPHVSDSDLEQAVIVVLRHNPGGGSIGVVTNKPTTTGVRAVASDWEDLCTLPSVVFRGGPVSHEGHIPLALLRPGAQRPTGFRSITGQLGTLPLSTEISVAESCVDELRLFSGYVGWNAGELESDIAGGILVPTTEPADTVFSGADRDLWRRLQRPR